MMQSTASPLLYVAGAATGGLICLLYGKPIFTRLPVRMQGWLSALSRLYRSPSTGTEPGQLNEVLFSSRKSSCCLNGTVAPDCSNAYCRSRIERSLLELMNAAQQTLSISMYFFTSQRLGDAVIAAYQRGVRVRVIGDKSMAYSKSSQLLRMAQKGIPIRFPVDYDGLVHHKFCLIDAIAPPEPAQRVNKAARVLGCPQISSSLPPNGVLISGSMNWTMQAISGNWENIVITSMPRIVEPFAQEFEKMWREFHRPIGMIQDLERLERKTEAILAVVSPHLN